VLPRLVDGAAASDLFFLVQRIGAALFAAMFGDSHAPSKSRGTLSRQAAAHEWKGLLAFHSGGLLTQGDDGRCLVGERPSEFCVPVGALSRNPEGVALRACPRQSPGGISL